MLETLRRIVQEVNLAHNLDQALNVIVRRVKNVMNADVCSVYLTTENHKEDEYVLMATEGLNPEAIGKVRMGENTGLVSLVGMRVEPINLEDATSHPRYLHFPEASEEAFHGFLGVPIIHHRKVLGVLIVQRSEAKKFSEDEETFLITVAAQLAAAIVHAEASGGIRGLKQDSKNTDNVQGAKPIHGLPGAPGVAIGTAVVMYPPADVDAIPDRWVDEIEHEVEVFDAAVSAVKQDIQNLSERLKDVLPDEDRALFDVYLLMLDSKGLAGITRDRIREGNWAPGALRETIQEHEKIFREMEDSYLRERADDVRDLGRRILMHLQKDTQEIIQYATQTVLVGEEISASMLAEVSSDKLAGVVSVRGSRTSHVAILARAMGIPAVMGVTDLPVSRIDGSAIIADGYSGRVYVSPTTNS